MVMAPEMLASPSTGRARRQSKLFAHGLITKACGKIFSKRKTSLTKRRMKFLWLRGWDLNHTTSGFLTSAFALACPFAVPEKGFGHFALFLAFFDRGTGHFPKRHLTGTLSEMSLKNGHARSS